jgi:hypothetical protein
MGRDWITGEMSAARRLAVSKIGNKRTKHPGNVARGSSLIAAG